MNDQPEPTLPVPEPGDVPPRPRRSRAASAALGAVRPRRWPHPTTAVAEPTTAAAEPTTAAAEPTTAAAAEPPAPAAPERATPPPAQVPEPPAEPAALRPPARATGQVDAVAVDLLEFERGAIGGVRASDVTARLAAVGGIAANQASVRQGFVSGIAAREAAVRQGYVRGMLAQEVHVEQGLVRSIVANTVHTGPSTGIFVAFARRIDGEAKILLDWRGALAFGAALGAFLAAIRLARR